MLHAVTGMYQPKEQKMQGIQDLSSALDQQLWSLLTDWWGKTPLRDLRLPWLLYNQWLTGTLLQVVITGFEGKLRRAKLQFLPSQVNTERSRPSEPLSNDYRTSVSDGPILSHALTPYAERLYIALTAGGGWSSSERDFMDLGRCTMTQLREF